LQQKLRQINTHKKIAITEKNQYTQKLQQILRQNQKHIKIAKTAQNHTHTHTHKITKAETNQHTKIAKKTATKSTHTETQKRTTIPKHRNQMLCKFRKMNKQKGGHKFYF
jgi:hypothetical protein